MKKILVPLALPDTPDAGLAVGAYFAEACDASLVLLHVVRHGFAEPASLVDEIRHQAETQLRAVALALRPSVPTEVRVRAGCPEDVIVNEARRDEAGAIVMCTHGCRGWRKWLHRNTALHVLRTAYCPVWHVAPGRNSETFSLTLANWSSGRLTRAGNGVLAFIGRTFFPGLKPVQSMSRIVFNLQPKTRRTVLDQRALFSALQHRIHPVA
jgi:nucleotide-binding universal stress UspA family protein